MWITCMKSREEGELVADLKGENMGTREEREPGIQTQGSVLPWVQEQHIFSKAEWGIERPKEFI